MHSYQKTDKFQLITDKLITLIERGVKPWQKPWSATPYGNLLTGHHYQGINPLICAIDTLINEWEQPFFVGFAQATEKGWKVQKGSKATYLRWGGAIAIESTNSETGETSKHYKNAGRWFNVFNVACLDDSDSDEKIGDYLEKMQVSGTNTEPRLFEAEALIKAQNVDVVFGGDVACYVPSIDKIRMPNYEDFTGAIAYYATYLHELVHATAHPIRLDRGNVGQFGSKSYSFEELIAEIGAAFLCSSLQIESQLEHHASYLDSWLSVLRDDNKAFFRAAGQAKKAADWLLNNAGLNTDESVAA
jgi:antirestriction protein ArdC